VTGIAAAEERLSGLRPVGRSGTGPTVDENSGTAGALSGREFLSPQAAALAAQGVPIFLTWRLFGSLPGYARVGRSETCLTVGQVTDLPYRGAGHRPALPEIFGR